MNSILEGIFFVAAVITMFGGLLVTLIPGVPGVFIIWLAALAYTVPMKFEGPGPIVFGLLTVTSLLGVTTDLWMRFLGAKYIGGASLWATLAGMVSSVVGLILFPPFGALIGLVAGTIVVEYLLKGSMRNALRVGGGTLGGYLLSSVVEVTLGLLTIALFIVGVLAVPTL